MLCCCQEEKLDALKLHGDKLLAQNHVESGTIGNRLAEVVQRRVMIRNLCNMRKQKLDDALLYTQFVRDVAEVGHVVSCRVVLCCVVYYLSY